MHMHRYLVGLFVLLLLQFPTTAQQREFQLPKLIKAPAKEIPGTLFLVGGGAMPKNGKEEFVKLAGGDNAQIVVIPTASETADTAKPEAFVESWKKYNPKSVQVLHTRSRETANDATFVKPLTEATAVWFGGGSQQRIADAYRGTLVQEELKKLLQRKGVIGGTSAGAAIMSELMIASGNPKAVTSKGLGFLTHTVIDQHFLKRNRVNRLLGVLRNHPGYFGIGIDEATAVIIRGRRISVLGESYAVICQTAGKVRPLSMQVLRPGEVADLVALSRSALVRAGDAFPPAKLRAPVVPKGTLIIGGGGGTPAEVWPRFVKAAGGPDANIVIIPTALGDPLPKQDYAERFFERAGVKNIEVIHTRDPQVANSEEFVEKIRKANGIWFSGGRQWRLVDSYFGTKAHAAMFDLLARGGVIGGSSAGASIQTEYMPRGNPLGNLDAMAEGYEQGLGFLPGVAVDQHFFRRKRQKDMTDLINTYPQLLGIGLDENTFIVVTGDTMEVIGKSKVAIYDRKNHPYPMGKEDYFSLTHGDQYNLRERRIVAPMTPAKTKEGK